LTFVVTLRTCERLDCVRIRLESCLEPSQVMRQFIAQETHVPQLLIVGREKNKFSKLHRTGAINFLLFETLKYSDLFPYIAGGILSSVASLLG